MESFVHRNLERMSHPVWSASSAARGTVAIDGAGGCGFGAYELATAAPSGAVEVWDPRCSGRAVVEMCDHGVKDAWSISRGGCSPDSSGSAAKFVVVGYAGGAVRCWDIRFPGVLFGDGLS